MGRVPEAMSANQYNVGKLGSLTAAELTALTESWQTCEGLEVDGKYGPKTRESVLAAAAHSKSGVFTSAPAIISSREWKPFDGPLDKLPRNRREVYAIFGNPGVGKVARKWKRDNIVTVRDFPGVPRKWHVSVHRLAEPYMREGLRRAHLVSPYVIERFGCFVFRHIRHDSANPLSMHSWGIAFDVDARRNFSQTYKRGEGPVAWSEEYMRVWPNGVDRAFVEALQSVGFAWGSDWDEDGMSTDHTYYDPMHFELVQRGGEVHRV